MRTSFAQLQGTRSTFRGTFSTYDTKDGFKRPVKIVLLTHITLAESGEFLKDQLSVSATKAFSKLRLRLGDIVEFDARVTKYKKRHHGNRLDFFDSTVTTGYQLSNPTKVKKVLKDDEPNG